MGYHKKEDKIKKCTCGKILWEWLDDDTIKILGTNGQDYEIGFNYVRLKCKECGEINSEHSLVADSLKDAAETANKYLSYTSVSRIHNPYDLNSFDKNKLLKELTEKQKEVYKMLSKKDFFNKMPTEEISKGTGLPEKIVSKHIDFIEQKLKEINHEFGKIKRTKSSIEYINDDNLTKNL